MSDEQSDGRRPRANVSALLLLPGVAGWTAELPAAAGEDGRRRLPNVGRKRLRKDERRPPRVRVEANGVDGASTKTVGESSELSASVLLDTLVVEMRLSDELPPPREKMDSRCFGNVTGNIASGVDDISETYIVH